MTTGKFNSCELASLAFPSGDEVGMSDEVGRFPLVYG